jgi:hypothetical protein
MKTQSSLTKQITWAVVYSIGFLAGHKYWGWGYWVGSIVFYFLFGYFIAFVFWVLAGWKIGHKDKPVKDKFGWHNKLLK